MAANLTITTLGKVVITLDNVPLENLPHKAKALLIYLACTREPQPRTTLVGLLWPEHGEKQAMTSLRVALTQLRKAVGPYLTITRQTVSMNRDSSYHVDLIALEKGVTLAQQSQTGSDLHSVPQLEELSQALSHYRGDFLAGFMVSDSYAFEEWVTLERERLRMQVIAAMQILVAGYMTLGRYQEGLTEATRLLQLDPLREESHRQLMRLYAQSGQRSTALQQYESCHQILDAELGVEPTAETVTLVEQIRNGELSSGFIEATIQSQATSSPTHSSSPIYQPPAVKRALFVGREEQMAELENALAQALAGHGQLRFVIGEAGAGKSALLNEFQVRVKEQASQLIIATGACDAQTGFADPYLPFREILTELATSKIGGQLLQEYGPDLIDTLVPSSALGVDAPMQGRASDAKSVEQSQIVAQTVQVLQAFAQQTPLLLILEDLHWVDDASMGLLFRLGRQLTGRRILMLGTYRSEEVRLGRDGDPNPFQKVAGELQNHLGDLYIDLDAARAAEGRSLVDALLDAEPNRLDASFRQRLYEHTSGHPLFVVELLRDLQSDGGLVQDADGQWIIGPELNWSVLPARVEGIIGVRMDRLDNQERQLLTTASVLGEHFIAEVVARALKIDGRQVAMQLSGALQKEHKLVQNEGMERVGRQRLTHYRFSHNLMQVYLYEQLDEVERSFLHENVAYALEELYGEQTEMIAVELAHHFELGGLPERAITYLLQAGQRATRVSAYQEALGHLNRGLRLLESLPNTKETMQQELDLQMRLGEVLKATEGWGASQVEQIYRRARELCRHIDIPSQQFHVVRALRAFYIHRAAYDRSRELADELLSLAHKANEPTLLVSAYHENGIHFYNLGEFVTARACFEQGLAYYDPLNTSRRDKVGRAEMDLLSTLAGTLWALGYPKQARSRADEAFILAQKHANPFGQALHALLTTDLYLALGDAEAAQERMDIAVAITDKMGSSSLMAVVNHGKGLILLQQGKAEEGVELLQRSLDESKSLGSRILQQTFWADLTKAYKQLGQIEPGLACVAEVVAFADQTGTRFNEATLYCLKGELIQQAEDAGIKDERIDAPPEACFLKAIEVARRQQAKSLELRATLSLVSLWQQQDRGQEALQMLSEIYGWFTEGFESKDLRAAKAILDGTSLNV